MTRNDFPMHGERLIGNAYNNTTTEIVMNRPPQMPLDGPQMTKVQKQMNGFLKKMKDQNQSMKEFMNQFVAGTLGQTGGFS